MHSIWWITALLTGIGGSLHCIAMCGPLALALPVGKLPTELRWPALLLYHAGRLAAYACLGVVVGLFGQGLELAGWQRPVSIGLGLGLLGWVVGRRLWPRVRLTPVSRRWVVSPMVSLLERPTLPGFTAFGFLNGLLPCGFVYVALAGALAMPGMDAPGVATPGLSGGVAYMLWFGLGTLPAMLGVRLLPNLLPVPLRHRLTRWLPVMTLLLGLLLIARGALPYAPANSRPGTDKPIPVCHGR